MMSGRLSSAHSFSPREIRDIFISTLVLTAAVVIMFRSGSVADYFERHFGGSEYGAMFAVIFVIMLLSFVGHEMGHKFMSQDLGCWAEYRMYPMGLLLALVMSVFGFLFAAPGAVYIRGNMTVEDNGRISIAGPAVNMFLAAVGIAGSLVLNETAYVVPVYLMASMNASLALFNMLPFGPLDGAKILRWNTGIYALAMGIAVVLFISFWFMPTIYYS